MTTVVNVASSIAAHMTPMLLAISASSMAKLRTWYIA